MSASRVEALAWPGPERKRRTALSLCGAVAGDQSCSPALADIIGARRVRTAAMISSHADLAAAAALAAAHEDRSAPLVEVVLGELKRLPDPQAGAP